MYACADAETRIRICLTEGNGDIDLSGLSSKHGRAYVYVWTGNEYLYDDGWEFSECDGMIHDGDMEMQRTLTVYRFSDSSSVVWDDSHR